MKSLLSFLLICSSLFALSTNLSKYKYIHQLDSVYRTDYKTLRHHYSEFHNLQLKIDELAKDTLERYNSVMKDQASLDEALNQIRANYPTDIKKLYHRTNQLESEIEGIKEHSLIETKEFDSWFKTNSQHYNKLHRELEVEKKDLDALNKNINYYEGHIKNGTKAYETEKLAFEKCQSQGGNCSQKQASMEQLDKERKDSEAKLIPLTNEFNKKAPLFNRKYQQSLDLAKTVNEESNRRRAQLEVMLTQNTERLEIKRNEMVNGKKKLDTYHNNQLNKTLLKEVESQNRITRKKIRNYNMEIAGIYGGAKIKHTLYEAAIFFDEFKKEDFVYSAPEEVKNFWKAYETSSNLPQRTVEVYEVTKDLMNIMLMRTKLMEEMDNGDIFFVCYMDDRMTKDQKFFLDQVFSSTHIESCHELSLANENLTKLKLYNRKLKDISLLEYFPHLESLDLSNNEILDFAPITKLKRVHYLKLRNNKLDANSIKEFCHNLGMDKKSCIYK